MSSIDIFLKTDNCGVILYTGLSYIWKNMAFYLYISIPILLLNLPFREIPHTTNEFSSCKNNY